VEAEAEKAGTRFRSVFLVRPKPWVEHQQSTVGDTPRLVSGGTSGNVPEM
jgi:hypothetical protein